MLRVFKYVFKYPAMIGIATLAMFTVIGIDQIVPLIQKSFIDDAILGGKSNLVVSLVIWLLVLALFKAILGYTKEFLYDLMSTKVHLNLKNQLFNHIQSFEFAYFDHMNTGELMARIGEDLENIWQTLGFGLRLLIENIFYIVLSTIILFSLNAKLAFICLILLIPIGFITLKLEKLFGACYGELSDQTAVINTTAQENIAGVRLIKAFAREKYEVKKFLKLNKRYYELNMRQASYMSKYFPIIDFLTNTALVAMIIFGGYMVLKEEMTLGTLTAFNTYIWYIVWPLRQLGWLTDMLSRTSASAKKIFAILDRPAEITSPDDAYCPDTLNGHISFKDVSFHYNEGEEVLSHINLDIPAGSTVAIMGTTGSGKSSLLNLIGRYYEPSSGEILIDGVPLSKWHLHTLRQNMSIVMQDTFLFSDTIADNVRFGKPNASMEEVATACDLACATPFIAELEEGYRTQIGERGVGLSGGQKQRLAIARAILRKAPILILDDATSALDTETEYELLTHLKEKNYQTTTFMIAHRISAVKNADIILYLENGKIVEQGNHETLLKKRGRYYAIYQKQFESFEEQLKEATYVC
ncbi:ABC transporter ATP-binding protein [Cellulosilyticum lentocellum]|uniref:Xenobiotic-transporting ATPase n=1 Tax=Cellulosilyticum lentocellum (strain ATCC 49066 / DSM 5427 / NCIMB 11756 / RHM5) TaxID=642492 RepID=F2JNK5_CELLD|nr:ABC transporter ATP-binding protein [Cellulosilyticum lentocellum]ADZ84781.1 Xenobiotic-transporting ATPase [Cellulosilyticum lentocellum DSM 5427]